VVRLAIPLMASSAGFQLMSFVDTVMVGRLGAEALAGVGIGNALFFGVSMFGIGCVLGMDALVSQAVGAREAARARRILWHGVRLAVELTVPITILLLAIVLALPRAGLDRAVAHESTRFVLSRLPNITPFLIFAAQRAFLQAHDITRPIMISMMFANIVNFVANALLIYGDDTLTALHLPAIGFPALGVVGSGLASSLASIASVAVLAAAIRGVPAPTDPLRVRLDRPLRRRLWALGLPIGGLSVSEGGMLAIVSVLTGWLGSRATAAHQICLTLTAVIFTAAMGIGSATAVRVGAHVGAGNTPLARRAGLLGIGAAAVIMVVVGIGFLAVPRVLGELLTSDPHVIETVVPVLYILAVFQVFDGTQCVAAGALRGAADTRASLIISLIGSYAIALPAAALLAFGLGWGIVGIWCGFLLNMVFVSIALVRRFVVLSSRTIQRVDGGE